jgi:hypothetical protein
MGLALLATLPATGGAHPQDRLLLTHPYTIEAAPSFPGGLFHWIDSLAGTTSGKTVPAHRAEYLRLFGPLTDDDRAHIHAFVAARYDHTNREGGRPSAMLGIFCGSATVEGALETLRPELTSTAWDGLAKALAHFRPRYEVVWNDGAIPKAFFQSARRDPGRDKLEGLLTKIVHFYGVDPLSVAPPRLALVPVPPGFGTHAEAIGNVLLLEIRDGEGLADEAGVVVHENSHFLWGLVPEDRKRRLTLAAAEMGDAATATFLLLGEAIPTALGQGVTDHAFRPSGWSPDGPWYHLHDVDACAKRIYPAVAAALEAGLTLDEDFIRRAILAAQAPS